MILSFHSEGLPLVLLIGQVCYWQTLFVLLIWEHLNFALVFKRHFWWIQNSWLTPFSFSFSTLNMSAHCLWSPWFLMRSQLLILLRIPFTWWVVLLFYFFQDSLSLVFISLTIMYLGMDHLKFIVLGVFWASWIWRVVLVIKLEKFLVIMSSNILSAPFSFASF